MSFQIVRKKLTPDEISPPYLRYDPDCDCVQTTPDGGVTWTDTPGQDPRIAPGFLKPPNSSEDPRCNAAANMVAALRSFIALDISATSTWGLASGFAAIYIFIFPVGVLIDLLIIIAGLIVGIGAFAIDEAFTEDVYDGLLCIFNNNIDSDGQMSDSQLADIYSAVASQFGGVVEAVFGAHSSGLGPNGWSNIGAIGTETGDCSECATCGCGLSDFTIIPSWDSDPYWVGFRNGARSLLDVGVGFVHGSDPFLDGELIQVEFSHSDAANVTTVTVTFTGTPVFVELDSANSGVDNTSLYDYTGVSPVVFDLNAPADYMLVTVDNEAAGVPYVGAIENIEVCWDGSSGPYPPGEPC